MRYDGSLRKVNPEEKESTNKKQVYWVEKHSIVEMCYNDEKSRIRRARKCAEGVKEGVT